MEKAGEIFENAILNWRDKGGIGTAIIPPPLNDKVMVLGILQRMYARSPTCDSLIIVNDFKERRELIEFLTTQEDTGNNDEFKKLIQDKYLKILTEDFVSKNNIRYPNLIIVYKPLAFTDTIFGFVARSRFKLVILTKFSSNVAETTKLYTVCPVLDSFKQNEIELVRTSTPVEEYQIPISMEDDTVNLELLAKYDEYITTSINIFGSFDIMQQCRVGNKQLNISAATICNDISRENGWNEHLDMSIEFNIEIDRLYNPINLRERASQTYEIIRLRSQLLSDYQEKLKTILDIVNENKDKKILIINKRAEFASKVTEYLNSFSADEICGNYHDKAEPIQTYDANGNPRCYKTGVNKGKPKLLGAQAQKTSNEKLFNSNLLNVLSTSSAPDKTLNVDLDIIIITSPQCEDIKSYLYRLNKVNYRNRKIVLYALYCKNSQEEKLLNNKVLADNHTIINKCEKCVINENNSDFVLVD